MRLRRPLAAAPRLYHRQARIDAEAATRWGGRLFCTADVMSTCSNDPGGSRTRDLRIKSPLLYQLSYRVSIRYDYWESNSVTVRQKAAPPWGAAHGSLHA